MSDVKKILKRLYKTVERKPLPHQREAIQWMFTKEYNSIQKGGILADEMGLGKTLTAECLCLTDFFHSRCTQQDNVNLVKLSTPGQHTLILANPLTMEHWIKEAKDLGIPESAIYVYRGVQEKKKLIERFDMERLLDNDSIYYLADTNKKRSKKQTDKRREYLEVLKKKYDFSPMPVLFVLTSYETLISEYKRFITLPTYQSNSAGDQMLPLEDDDLLENNISPRDLDSDDEDGSGSAGNGGKAQRQYRGILFRKAWHRAILDEAHQVRNRSSTSFRAASSLQRVFTWCLTGTPVINNTRDAQVISLLCAGNDNLFSCEPAKFTQWKEKYVLRRTKEVLLNQPKMHHHSIGVDLSDVERKLYDAVFKKCKELVQQKRANQRKLEKEKQQKGNKRVRVSALSDDDEDEPDDEVDDSSNAEEDDDDEELSDMDILREFYDSDYEEQTAQPSSANNTKKKRSAATQRRTAIESIIVSFITRLRQICSHPLVPLGGIEISKIIHGFDYTQDDDLENEERWSDDESNAPKSTGRRVNLAHEHFKEFVPLIRKYTDLCSSKMKEALKIIVHDISKRDKVVVFSQFMVVLLLMSVALDKMHINNFVIHGQMPMDHRQTILKKFASKKTSKNSYRVLLCSFKLGNVGLNLRAANHVIKMEPWWNDSIEKQAEDRINRIGQKKEMHSYSLYCRNTAEEMMISLKEIKRKNTNDFYFSEVVPDMKTYKEQISNMKERKYIPVKHQVDANFHIADDDSDKDE